MLDTSSGAACRKSYKSRTPGISRVVQATLWTMPFKLTVADFLLVVVHPSCHR